MGKIPQLFEVLVDHVFILASPIFYTVYWNNVNVVYTTVSAVSILLGPFLISYAYHLAIIASVVNYIICVYSYSYYLIPGTEYVSTVMSLFSTLIREICLARPTSIKKLRESVRAT
jgi:hypothetical protein